MQNDTKYIVFRCSGGWKAAFADQPDEQSWDLTLEGAILMLIGSKIRTLDLTIESLAAQIDVYKAALK